MLRPLTHDEARRIAANIAKLAECGGPRTLALYRILRITQRASADTVD